MIANEATATGDLDQGHVSEPAAPATPGPLPRKPAAVPPGKPVVPALGLRSLSDQPGGSGRRSVRHLQRASGILPDGLLFDIPGIRRRAAAPSNWPTASSRTRPRWTCTWPFRSIASAASTWPPPRARAAPAIAPKSSCSATKIPAFRKSRCRWRARICACWRKAKRSTATPPCAWRASSRTEAGTFQLDPRFVPPLLDFAASDYLVSIARRLVEILTARSSAIAGMRRQKNQSLADFTAADIANFWLLYTINTAFPTFRHLFETRGGHPEALYSAMLVAGRSADHVFAPLFIRAICPPTTTTTWAPASPNWTRSSASLLETVVPSNFVSLPLKLVQPSIYATVDRQRQVPGEHQDVPGGERRNQPGRDRRQDSATGEGLFGQPHRAPGAPGAARRAAHLRGRAARAPFPSSSTTSISA